MTLSGNYRPKLSDEELDQMISNQKRMTLTTSAVPSELHSLLFYAQRWGIYDETLQFELLRRASDEELDNLIKSIKPNYLKISDWLASPTVDDEYLPNEYIAFTNLLTAVDAARMILRSRSI